MQYQGLHEDGKTENHLTGPCVITQQNDKNKNKISTLHKPLTFFNGAFKGIKRALFKWHAR